MTENPYQPPRLPAEQEIPTPGRLRVDWRGLVSAILVIMLIGPAGIALGILINWASSSR